MEHGSGGRDLEELRASERAMDYAMRLTAAAIANQGAVTHLLLAFLALRESPMRWMMRMMTPRSSYRHIDCFSTLLSWDAGNGGVQGGRAFEQRIGVAGGES